MSAKNDSHRKECPECDGSGFDPDTDESEDCPECEGTGWVWREDNP